MSLINEQLVVEAAEKTYLRWADQDKDWAAATQLGVHEDAEVVADIIVDSEEELAKVVIADDPATEENESNHVVAESDVRGAVVKEEAPVGEEEVEDEEEEEVVDTSVGEDASLDE